jgi:endonuclease/exonuclease/phosphatase family metal-dependent hydrolase
VFVASRLDVELAQLELPTFDHQLPANVLSVRFPGSGLRVLALRIPAYKAHQQDLTGRSWDWLGSVAKTLASEAAVIIGDLNVPALSTQGVGAETLRRIGALGWSMASSATAASYFSPRGRTSTLDYLLHGPTIAVHRALFVTEASGFMLAGSPDALSDHAALVADLEVQTPGVRP